MAPNKMQRPKYHKAMPIKLPLEACSKKSVKAHMLTQNTKQVTAY